MQHAYNLLAHRIKQQPKPTLSNTASINLPSITREFSSSTPQTARGHEQVILQIKIVRRLCNGNAPLHNRSLPQVAAAGTRIWKARWLLSKDQRNGALNNRCGQSSLDRALLAILAMTGRLWLDAVQLAVSCGGRSSQHGGNQYVMVQQDAYGKQSATGPHCQSS
jgi:hypothetical protein